MKHLVAKRISGVLAVFSLLLLGLLADAAYAGERLHFRSRHYDVHSTLASHEVAPIADHMDQVFEEYQRRFANAGLRVQNDDPMPLYVFRTRGEYIDFLSQHQINGANTGGMFFVQPSIQGLATYTRGKSMNQVLAVLQHEGFHQFAYRYIGPNLPIWVNEGLAQYFEDGILIDGELRLNYANGERIRSLKLALEQQSTIPFNHLFTISPNDWGRTLNSKPEQATLLYDQSWSMVFFLITADDGRYREAFEGYLRHIGKGRKPVDAFESAFGTRDVGAFERVWKGFATAVEPDEVSTARARLEFLGQGLKYLAEHNAPMPSTLSELRRVLRRINFRAIHNQHGIESQTSARDEAVYTFATPTDGLRYFKVQYSGADGLPPSISAPGLTPSPTLVWFRDAEGQVVMDVSYR